MSTPSDFDLSVGGDIEQVRETQSHIEPFDWFARFWGIAVVAHIVGNPRIGQVFNDPTMLGWASLITGIVAIAVVVDPTNRDLLRLVCVGVLVTVWFEAPVIGNHWLLAGVISIAILVSLTMSDSWVWFSTTGRGIHLAFYAFAAFAKLNSSYFDPTASCGVFYANQTLSSIGLPEMAAGSALAVAVVWISALIELAIPGLLVLRRTRNVGIALGLTFHTLISFDLGQHFFDFTAVLIPLFLLWARPSLPVPLGKPLSRNLRLMIALLLGLFVVVSVLPLTKMTDTILDDSVFIAWIPASLALLGFVGWRLDSPGGASFRPQDALAWLLVGFVIFNGLTPYLELKTATAWNMYSNLYTAGGESNHFLVRSTLPLSNGQTDPVAIISSNDEGLQQYIDSGYVLPERTFLQYLSEHPGAVVEIEQNGDISRVTSDDGSRLNPLLERFGLLRAIDVRERVQCQAFWLPAR